MANRMSSFDFVRKAGDTMRGDLDLGLNVLKLTNGVYGGVIKGQVGVGNVLLIQKPDLVTDADINIRSNYMSGDIWLDPGKKVDEVDISEELDQFVDRGDPSSADFDETDLTVAGSWTDLDLSGIIPAGTTAVVLKVGVADNAVEQSLRLRTKGNSNAENVSQVTTQVSNVGIVADCIVPTGGLQLIQYYLSATMDLIEVTVKGWLI